MRKRPLMTACILILAIRYLMFLAGSERTFPPELLSMDGKKICMTGVVNRKELREKGLALCVLSEGKQYLVYDSGKREVKIGNTIRIVGTFHLLETASNPGMFDARSYYQTRKIYGSIISNQITVKNRKTEYWKEGLHKLRERWEKVLLSRMGEETGGILAGILLGDKHIVEPEIRELYQKNGIAHLLAVSGLHVSFAGVIVYQFLRKRGFPFWICALAGISVLIPYAFMTGFSISARRAVMMYTIRMGAQVSGQAYDLLTSLIFSGTVLLCQNPMYLTDSGFLLSFGAMLAVWAGEEMIRSGKQRKEKQRFQKVWEVMVSGLCIQVFTLPILLTTYYEFPLYAVFLNIWVIPAMSVLMGAGMTGSALCIICPGAADVPFQVVSWILFFYKWSCRMILQLPYARMITGKPDMWQILLYLFILWTIYWKREHGKARHKVVMLIAAGGILLGRWQISVPCAEVTMIDVGQGEGVFVRSAGGMACLIDGGSTSEKELAKRILEPFLEYRGIDRLNYVFASHGDEDHIGGIREMLQRQETGVRIENLVLPDRKFWDDSLETLAETAKKNGTHVMNIRKEERIEGENGFRIRCHGPSETYRGQPGNAASMILEIDAQDFSMLCTGDLEGEGETLFLKEEKSEKQYSVLKIAHHGSGTGTTNAFLKKNKALLAVISAGRRNRYGHPAKETLDRLDRYGIPFLCTQNTGAITIRTDGKSMRISKFLE